MHKREAYFSRVSSLEKIDKWDHHAVRVCVCVSLSVFEPADQF